MSQPGPGRILDANRNRALEALRVIEEYARFILEREDLAASIKGARHALVRAAALAGIDQALEERDAAGDVGRPGRGAGALSPRASIDDVLRANLSRAKEALRALEEYSRLKNAEAADAFEQVRYQVYELERSLLSLRARDRARLARQPLCLILTPSPTRPPLLDMARAALAGGCRFFQLRMKQADDRDILKAARALGELCRREDALLVINDRADIARLTAGAGLHLGQEDLAPEEARRILGEERVVGRSIHNRAELEGSRGAAIDYFGLGTIFASPTKPELGSAGTALIAALAPEAGRPLFAIGGVSAANAGQARAAGATGVAVSSAILDAADIAAATAAVIAAVEASSS